MHIGTSLLLLTLEPVPPREHVQATHLGRRGHREKTQVGPADVALDLTCHQQQWLGSTQSNLGQRNFPDEPSALSATRADLILRGCLKSLVLKMTHKELRDTV